ncbi:MAG: diguanylate cyclase [Lachnospiraceae bacterium]|nr:diguanylate cyclase [Lachnospiraceae bacterium]
MKKKIRNLLVFLISGMVLLFLLINYVVQIMLTQQDITDESEIVFRQVQRLIEEDVTVDRIERVGEVFSQCAVTEGTILIGADPQTKQVIGATDTALTGRTLRELGVEKGLAENGSGFYTKSDGKIYFCVLEELDDLIFVRMFQMRLVVMRANDSIWSIALYAVLVGIGVVWAVQRYLDRHILSSIDEINAKLQQIADGKLDQRVEVNNTPEFAELSGYINTMVDAILATTDKLSAALDAAEVPIGIYEYRAGMDRVQATSRVAELLNLSPEQAKELFADYRRMERFMTELCRHTSEQEPGLYRCDGVVPRWLKIETIPRDRSVFGILIDKTEDTLQKQRLQQELLEDDLTKLRSRRGFQMQVQKQFENPETLREAALLMLDADDLKWVNDTYGHETGDRYLQTIAEILRSISGDGRILSHLSGDEFAVFFYGQESYAKIEAAVRQIRTLRDQKYLLSENIPKVQVRFSMGLARWNAGMVYEDLAQRADERMYQEKQSRKTRLNRNKGIEIR